MEKRLHFEGSALIVLSLMLVTVFVASVGMYDALADESADGSLAVFASAVREFLDENEAVSVFLGIEGDMERAADLPADREEVSAAAAAYIERYNRIYESLE